MGGSGMDTVKVPLEEFREGETTRDRERVADGSPVEDVESVRVLVDGGALRLLVAGCVVAGTDVVCHMECEAESSSDVDWLRVIVSLVGG